MWETASALLAARSDSSLLSATLFSNKPAYRAALSCATVVCDCAPTDTLRLFFTVFCDAFLEARSKLANAIALQTILPVLAIVGRAAHKFLLPSGGPSGGSGASLMPRVRALIEALCELVHSDLSSASGSELAENKSAVDLLVHSIQVLEALFRHGGAGLMLLPTGYSVFMLHSDSLAETSVLDPLARAMAVALRFDPNVVAFEFMQVEPSQDEESEEPDDDEEEYVDDADESHVIRRASVQCVSGVLEGFAQASRRHAPWAIVFASQVIQTVLIVLASIC